MGIDAPANSSAVAAENRWGEWHHRSRSSIDARLDHTVIHVSYTDVRAFAAWAGGRLPREAAWEYAARGGRDGATFPWGDREPDDIEFQPCNIRQGTFPDHNSAADGCFVTAPVAAFEPNGFGLYNLVGNTWEWCADSSHPLAVAAREGTQPGGASEPRARHQGRFTSVIAPIVIAIASLPGPAFRWSTAPRWQLLDAALECAVVAAHARDALRFATRLRLLCHNPIRERDPLYNMRSSRRAPHEASRYSRILQQART